MTRPTKQNYINETELQPLLLQWKEDKKNNKPMSNALGTAILTIAQGIISKIRYTNLTREEREDAMCVALINCIKYVHSFNIDKCKSKNPAFTYITFTLETSIRGYLKILKMKDERLPTVSLDVDILE